MVLKNIPQGKKIVMEKVEEQDKNFCIPIILNNMCYNDTLIHEGDWNECKEKLLCLSGTKFYYKLFIVCFSLSHILYESILPL